MPSSNRRRSRRILEAGEQPDLECSFCGKAEGIVKKLVAGPGVYICDECVELAVQIIREDGPASEPAE